MGFVAKKKNKEHHHPSQYFHKSSRQEMITVDLQTFKLIDLKLKTRMWYDTFRRVDTAEAEFQT